MQSNDTLTILAATNLVKASDSNESITTLNSYLWKPFACQSCRSTFDLLISTESNTIPISTDKLAVNRGFIFMWIQIRSRRVIVPFLTYNKHLYTNTGCKYMSTVNAISLMNSRWLELKSTPCIFSCKSITVRL